MNFTVTAGFIWSVAELLRGDYRQSDYGKVILPFTLLRRLDCVLEGTKADVLEEYGKRKDLSLPLEQFLTRKAKQSFYNTSPLDIRKRASPTRSTPSIFDDRYLEKKGYGCS